MNSSLMWLLPLVLLPLVAGQIDLSGYVLTEDGTTIDYSNQELTIDGISSKAGFNFSAVIKASKIFLSGATDISTLQLEANSVILSGEISNIDFLIVNCGVINVHGNMTANSEIQFMGQATFSTSTAQTIEAPKITGSYAWSKTDDFLLNLDGSVVLSGVESDLNAAGAVHIGGHLTTGGDINVGSDFSVGGDVNLNQLDGVQSVSANSFTAKKIAKPMGRLTMTMADNMVAHQLLAPQSPVELSFPNGGTFTEGLLVQELIVVDGAINFPEYNSLNSLIPHEETTDAVIIAVEGVLIKSVNSARSFKIAQASTVTIDGDITAAMGNVTIMATAGINFVADHSNIDVAENFVVLVSIHSDKTLVIRALEVVVQNVMCPNMTIAAQKLVVNDYIHAGVAKINVDSAQFGGDVYATNLTLSCAAKCEFNAADTTLGGPDSLFISGSGAWEANGHLHITTGQFTSNLQTLKMNASESFNIIASTTWVNKRINSLITTAGGEINIGSLNSEGALEINANILIVGSIHATAPVTLRSVLSTTISGAIDVENGDLVASGDMMVGGNITVANGILNTEMLAINVKDAEAFVVIHAKKAVQLNRNFMCLNSKRVRIFSGSNVVYAYGDVQTNGALEVVGDFKLGGDLNIVDDLSIKGSLSVIGEAGGKLIKADSIRIVGMIENVQGGLMSFESVSLTAFRANVMGALRLNTEAIFTQSGEFMNVAGLLTYRHISLGPQGGDRTMTASSYHVIEVDGQSLNMDTTGSLNIVATSAVPSTISSVHVPNGNLKVIFDGGEMQMNGNFTVGGDITLQNVERTTLLGDGDQKIQSSGTITLSQTSKTSNGNLLITGSELILTGDSYDVNMGNFEAAVTGKIHLTGSIRAVKGDIYLGSVLMDGTAMQELLAGGKIVVSGALKKVTDSVQFTADSISINDVKVVTGKIITNSDVIITGTIVDARAGVEFIGAEPKVVELRNSKKQVISSTGPINFGTNSIVKRDGDLYVSGSKVYINGDQVEVSAGNLDIEANIESKASFFVRYNMTFITLKTVLLSSIGPQDLWSSAGAITSNGTILKQAGDLRISGDAGIKADITVNDGELCLGSDVFGIIICNAPGCNEINDVATCAPASPSKSMTSSISITSSPSRSPTISITPSRSPTISITPSNTPTISITPSNTPTISVTRSYSSTISVTASVSRDGEISSAQGLAPPTAMITVLVALVLSKLL